MSRKAKLTRTQELVYEMRVREVMTSNVVTVTPETSMKELREVLRSKRISGCQYRRLHQLVGERSPEGQS
jgi:CBS domain-containing protein